VPEQHQTVSSILLKYYNLLEKLDGRVENIWKAIAKELMALVCLSVLN
jgi:hypothetical protein